MRVVVTGATGNVGTSVVEALAADAAVDSVVAIARRLPGPGWRPPKTEFVAADVRTSDLTPLFAGATAVVHLAWMFQPTHRPLVTWENNVLGTVRVLDAVAAAEVPALVYASSVGAYSPAPKGVPVDESWSTHGVPTASYGREKSYAERVLDTFELRHPAVRVVRMRPAFIFKRESATEQRRIFAGPLVPGRLIRSRFVPVVPDIPGLTFQALHSSDAGEAYRLAATGDATGAFNLAADPTVDARVLADLFDARTVPLPRRPLRAAVSAAWRLHLVPASPWLLDLALSLPVMDATRARTELGWRPRFSATDALHDFVLGAQERAGIDTPPLDPDPSGVDALA